MKRQTYKVIKTFADLQDDKHLYKPGDDYPRKGLEVTEARINELASDKNAANMQLIEAVKGEQ